ncbi:hypothetical protein B0H11DRAFT_2060211 [Mycena galericulata]|nr:hypothetical protein B0H11DRAFT_2060211 [Mycena galericulata]
MENKENPKTSGRPPKSRPLPTPGSVSTQPSSSPTVADEPMASTSVVPSSPQRPTSPVKNSSAVASSSISTSSFYSSQPPTLPSRPKNLGSSHTTVWPPTDTQWPPADPLPSYSASISSSGYREPELVPDTEDEMPELISSDQATGDWGTGGGWNTGGGEWNSWWPRDLVKIDGRDVREEENWWDPKRNRENRPGPGMLSPRLADDLHDPGHTLFSVSFTAPQIPQSTSSQSSQSSSGSTSASLPPDPPSFDEVRAASPHPDAYYCPKDNGWVILSWGYSEAPPPLARSFQVSSHCPLPRPIRRSPENCLDSTANETHHFHKYEKAVDAHHLQVPFRFDRWDTIETVKLKRRVGTVLPEELDLEKIAAEDEDKMDVDEEGPLLDLYVCCQCTFYLVRSAVIPGVIPRLLWDDFLKEKNENPQPGKTPMRGTAMAMETLLMAIENKLWKGEARMLRVDRPGFQNKIGWSPTIKKVFEALGFSGDTFDTESGLRPPITDINLPQGKQNRAKLLRAWTEIGSWMADFERLNPSLFQHDHKGYKLWVKVDNIREKYQLAIGAHPTQISRADLDSAKRAILETRHEEWRSLGMTPTTYSPELLTFAYLAQCRCDPDHTIDYFSSLRTLSRALESSGSDPFMLVQLIASEGSRGRFAHEDIEAAAATLGFGAEGYLKVEYGTDVSDEFVEHAWKDRRKRDYENGDTLQNKADEALKILAAARGSHALRKAWENRDIMDPDLAYRTLEVPKTTDEEMLITVFNMRLEEQPSQIEKMKTALKVIAFFRNSERLRKFLEIGHDPGAIVEPTRMDLPRGLNQLGNTCYLNSLLQYFYTIKELRAAVRPMDGIDKKSIEDDKLTDDDLKRHRVGGRLVTRREIIRSKKFISRLANLFHELEYCEAAAVTPHLELAKLALVTSKDEEEDEDKGGTDSSNDTDATLVDDGPARITASDQPDASSPTQDSAMNMDTDNAPVRSTSPLASGEASSSKIPAAPSAADSTVAKKPPQLPPRKTTEVSDSTMMFGKQHDVAECMDNCMFQIETALLKFDAMSGSQEDANKTSVVKRLFYGKIRQRIASDEPQSRSSVHEKEDLFSHLPVNVADDGVDIYDGLSGYFDDVVEFQGKKARMEVTLLETPPLLQIQLQRVQFNRDTLQPYKSQAYVKFGETIYMDRFLDSADPQKKARAKVIQAELTKCRERIRTLLTGKRIGTYATILKNVHAFVSAQDGVDDELVTDLRTEQEQIGHEIDLLRVRIDELKDALEELWRDCTDAPYELTSVFIHRGSSPSWGHYFFYSRHLPDSPDSWFKYNDSDVTVIDKSEVLADTTGSTANPYLLVFARKGSEVVETVNRFDVANLT